MYSSPPVEEVPVTERIHEDGAFGEGYSQIIRQAGEFLPFYWKRVVYDEEPYNIYYLAKLDRLNSFTNYTDWVNGDDWLSEDYNKEDMKLVNDDIKFYSHTRPDRMATPPNRRQMLRQLETVASILSVYSDHQQRNPEKRIFDRKWKVAINYNWVYDKSTDSYRKFVRRRYPNDLSRTPPPVYSNEPIPSASEITLQDLLDQPIVAPSVSLNHRNRPRKRKRDSDEFEAKENIQKPAKRIQIKRSPIRF